MKKSNSPKLNTPTYIAIVITIIMVLISLILGLMVIQSQDILGEANTCTFNGVTYKTGNNFPAGDSCNTCVCAKGEVLCTEAKCESNNNSSIKGILDSIENKR